MEKSKCSRLSVALGSQGRAKIKGERQKRGRTDTFLALAFPRSFSRLLSCFRSSTTAESLEQARSNFKTQLYTFQLFYHSSKSHLLAIKHYVSRFIFELRIKTTIYSSCIRRWRTVSAISSWISGFSNSFTWKHRQREISITLCACKVNAGFFFPVCQLV